MILGRMRWSDICTVHWEVPVRVLVDWIPDWLEPHTLEGKAYVSAIALRAIGPAPPMPSLLLGAVPAYSQVNVRTYVRGPNGPGMLLRRTAVDSLLAAVGANLAGQPYRAQDGMEVSVRGGKVHVESDDLAFRGRITGETFTPEPGSLESFLLDRYVVYGTLPTGRGYHLRVRHRRWSLRKLKITSSDTHVHAVERAGKRVRALWAEPIDVDFVEFGRVPLGSPRHTALAAAEPERTAMPHVRP